MISRPHRCWIKKLERKKSEKESMKRSESVRNKGSVKLKRRNKLDFLKKRPIE